MKLKAYLTESSFVYKKGKQLGFDLEKYIFVLVGKGTCEAYGHSAKDFAKITAYKEMMASGNNTKFNDLVKPGSEISIDDINFDIEGFWTDYTKVKPRTRYKCEVWINGHVFLKHYYIIINFVLDKSYNPNEIGLIYTDRLFLKSAQTLLKRFKFPLVNKIDYSEQGKQGRNYVNFEYVIQSETLMKDVFDALALRFPKAFDYIDD